MKYNEVVERYAPRLGRKNLANGLSCPPFVYMEDSDDGMWVHYVTYCENIRKLKRALWLARANRALEKIAWFKLWNTSISTMNPEDGSRQEYEKWKKALGKFLAKAEEYK